MCEYHKDLEIQYIFSEEETIMKKIYKGIVEGDTIHFDGKIDLPVGTNTLVTLKTLSNENQEEITSRQIKLLNKGFYLGKKLYSHREDLYDR